MRENKCFKKKRDRRSKNKKDNLCRRKEGNINTEKEVEKCNKRHGHPLGVWAEACHSPWEMPDTELLLRLIVNIKIFKFIWVYTPPSLP